MNKTAVNKINIKTTSIHYFKSLTRNTFSKSWLRFFAITIILFIFAYTLLYFFGFYFPMIIVMWITIIWFKVRMNRINKIKALDAFKIPNYIWIAFKQRHPEIHSSSYKHIEEGFKDYLALHIWKRNTYVMPSHSVDAIWHLLLEEFEGFYRLMCSNFLGYYLFHKPHDQEPTEAQRIAQQQQLANTWQAACYIHGLNPANTQILPRIFQVDQHVGWENGLIFSLPFLLSIYAQTVTTISAIPIDSTSTQSSCASAHSACTSSTSSCSGSSSDSSSSHHGSDSSSDSGASCSSCSSCGGSSD